MKRKIALIACSIIISVGLIELVIRVVNPQLTFQRANSFAPRCHEKSDIQPFTLPKNYTCRMVHYLNDYHTTAMMNSHGYRGKEFPLEKTPGVIRMLVLGDSMTFGIGVSDVQTYPSKLEIILQSSLKKPVEVINAGYANGFSPDSYLVYLNERGFSLRPDMIILSLFVWNDISDLSETVWETVDGRGLPQKISSCCRVIDGNVLRNKYVGLKYRYPILRDFNLFIATVDVLQKRFGFFTEPSNTVAKRDLNQGCILNPSCIGKFQEEEEKVKKVIAEMKRLADSANIPLVAVILPVDIQINPSGWGKYGSTWFPDAENVDFIQKRIGGWLTETKIEYLDALPALVQNKQRGNLFFPNDAHFTVLGNQIVAEAIASFIHDKVD